MIEEYNIAGMRYALIPSGHFGKRYGNQKCKLIAIGEEAKLFDSMGEARRYIELLRMQALGQIAELHRPNSIPLTCLHPETHERFTICTYRPDFQYNEGGRRVNEDSKSPFTANDPAFKIKRKLFDFLNPDNPLKVTIRR